MRFAAVFFAFSAVAFAQSAPDNNLQQAGQLKFNDLKALPGLGQTIIVTRSPARNPVCAIPLLNALPAQSKVDYKLRIEKPATPTERVSPRAVGIPACQ